MYSSLGLQDWELLVVSGLCAFCAFFGSMAIGAVVALIVVRDPVAAAEPAKSRAVPRPHEAPVGKPQLVMG